MQNNVTDLSQKLQRSLDNNYNVIDMPAVVDVISALEKTPVTKELLETTRLGKYINELRRKTSNETLARRAKELLKKWRDLILPDANGQINTSRSDSPAGLRPNKKRSARTPPDSKTPKRISNGQTRELDFSDNSNCSIKDYKKTDVIFINSDSNSSLPEHGAEPPVIEDSIPKKRGRKKGSKNHKNLVLAAEESFTNKMAISRNSKVKTTQELLADLQNRTTTPKNSSHQDIELRAAQLTESLSRIDQKLNPQKQINKNVTPIRSDKQNSTIHAIKSVPHRTLAEVENWSRTSTPEVVTIQSDDEIVDVVGTDPPSSSVKSESTSQQESEPRLSEPLSIETLLSQLPPVDPEILNEPEEVPPCLCPLPPVVEPTQEDRITVQIVGEESSNKSLFAPSPPSPLSFDKTEGENHVEDPTRTDLEELSANCAARDYLRAKYLPDIVTDTKVTQLLNQPLPNVNGNFGVWVESPCEEPSADIVPKLGAERLPKENKENFQKYSISIDGDRSLSESDEVREKKLPSADSCDRTGGAEQPTEEFREWHETVDVRSYNGTLLRILPYVIID